MNADIVNSLFEGLAAGFLWLNVRQLMIDKQLQGVRILPTVFYSLWGVWNLYYYPSLDQWFSFFAGIAVVTVNACWLALAYKYTRGK